MDPNRFATHSLRDPRLLRILAAALDAVEPGAAVRRYLVTHPLPQRERIFALAIGKAALPMMEGLASVVQLEDGLAITKHAAAGTRVDYAVLEGGHPVPDERSLVAGKAALEFAGRLGTRDLLVCLISGGGSALVSAPRIPLEELRKLTSALLASGARIDEINTLRRHLDKVKGGGLARAANGARVVSLVLSDVVGNPLEAIASGPTAPDPTTQDDAMQVVRKYGLEQLLEAGNGLMHETLKPGDPIFTRVQNVIVASSEISVKAALGQAEKEGFQTELLTTNLQGEASIVGRELAQRLRVATLEEKGPFCLIAGGETTVTLRGKGRGGRNQELALAALPDLAEMKEVLFISLATDGEDGPTDAAGAVVTGESLERARRLGLDVAGALAENNSYPVFEALGDLIKSGPTGTNVNDIVLMMRL